MAVKIIDNFDAFEKKVMKKAQQFIAGANAVISARSRAVAPIAYGTLVNSLKTSIKVNGTEVVGEVGYYVTYAKVLDQAPAGSWKPKPPKKYGNKKKGIPQANAWNPRAKPGFLSDVMDGPAARDIENLKTIFRF